MKPVFCAAFALMAQSLFGQFLPASISHLDLECKSASVSSKVDTDQSGLWGSREHHQTLELEVKNLGSSATDVLAVVYFFIRDASRHNSDSIYLDGSKTNLLTVPGGQSMKCLAEMPFTTEDVDNIEQMGAGSRAGDKPAGWIAGFLSAGKFYPLQASSPSMLDKFNESDDLQSQWADFEKHMPKDLAKRQKEEDPSNPRSIAATYYLKDD